MPCTPFKVGDLTGIVCTRGGRKRKCKACGGDNATRLCDFPIGDGKTCDRPLCGKCAVQTDREHDYCPHHDLRNISQQSLF